MRRFLVALLAMVGVCAVPEGAGAQAVKDKQTREKQARDQQAQCAAEARRLAPLFERMEMQVVGGAARTVAERIVIRYAGLRALREASEVDLITSFSGTVLVDDMPAYLDLVGDEGTEETKAKPGKQVLFPATSQRESRPDTTSFSFIAGLPGDLVVTAALRSRKMCGERPFLERRVNLAIRANPKADAIRAAGADACRVETEVLREAAAPVSITISAPDIVRAGEPITVRWKRARGVQIPSLPYHLVLAMPDGARFEGPGMLPLPPGAKAPSGIAYKRDGLRVFVPLASIAGAEEGSFKVVPYRTGPFTLSPAVVARSSACGERVLKEMPQRALQVEAGEPRLLIQDFYSLDAPERVVVSDDGRYRLEVFPASYRVFDVATGTKIIDRAGRTPNFSPTARFVGAYVSGNENIGGDMEIVDLVTGDVVPRMSVRGPMVGWGLGDALVVDGTQGHPEIHVRRALVNPSFHKPYAEMDVSNSDQEAERDLVQASTSGRGSSAWERYRVRVLLDQGLVVIEDRFPPQEELLRVSVHDLATGKQLGHTDRMNGAEVALVRALYGVDGLQAATGWDLGERLRLSHYSPSIDADLPRLAEKDEKGKTVAAKPFPRQRTFLHEHKGEKRQTTPMQVAAAAESTLTRSLGWRAAAVKARTTAPKADPKRFGEQLAQFGICVEPGCSEGSIIEAPTPFVERSVFWASNFQYGGQTTTFLKPAKDLEQAIVKDVPLAKGMITGKPNNVCYTGGEHSKVRIKGVADEDAFSFRIVPDKDGRSDVHGIWNWRIGERRFWLVQVVCSHAGISNAPAVLFSAEGKEEGKILILGGSPFDSKDLNEDFVGSGNEGMLRLRPWILDKRWLILAAPASSAAAIVDLAGPGETVIVGKLKDAFAIAGLYRSKDGSQLVQLNTDGRFTVKRTKDSSDVISGRWIDDEVVLYTPNGYYHGTYEGDQFVHLAFRGESDLVSLAQLERTLHRPDIIEKVIAGEISDGPKPQLMMPPRLRLSLNGGDATTLALSASAQGGLGHVRFFDDGQLVKELAVSGRVAQQAVTFDQPLLGRWISALAEDRAGMLSTPVSIANPRPAREGSGLHAVVVGVDQYVETNLQLNFARSDAQRFAGALKQREGKYYGRVEVTELLDGQVSAQGVLSELEAAVARARKGDTVLFFFAGHGVRGSDGGYYLAPPELAAADPAGTGLAWAKVAAVIAKSQVRVVVILDACHSGATGVQGFAGNDEAAGELLRGGHAPIIVLAASKGRQYSFEDLPNLPPKWGGGVFTHALVETLTRKAGDADRNGNGALEISEVYRSLKSIVSEETGGEQTPWLVRRDLTGDFALF